MTMETPKFWCATWPNKALFHERVWLQLVARPHTLANKMRTIEVFATRGPYKRLLFQLTKTSKTVFVLFVFIFGFTNWPKAINAAAFQETINAFLAISSDHIWAELCAKCGYVHTAWKRLQWECRHQRLRHFVANCLLLRMRKGKSLFGNIPSYSNTARNICEVWMLEISSDSVRPATQISSKSEVRYIWWEVW